MALQQHTAVILPSRDHQKTNARFVQNPPQQMHFLLDQLNGQINVRALAEPRHPAGKIKICCSQFHLQVRRCHHAKGSDTLAGTLRLVCNRWVPGLDYEAQQLSLFCLTEASSSSDVIGSGTETTTGMGIQTANPAASICTISLKRGIVESLQM